MDATGEPVPEPPREPFHRLARTARYRWWKPLAEGSALVGVYVLLLLITVPVLGELFDGAHDGAGGLITLTVTLAMLWPAAWIAAALLGRDPRQLSSVEGRLRWRWLGTCGVVAAVFMAGSIAVQLVLAGLGASLGPERGGFVGLAEFLPLALVVVVFVPFQAVGEEYVFRGTLLQTIGAWARPPVVAIAISSGVFAIAHGFDPPVLVAIGVSGAVFAWLTIRTGGLEAAIALHVLNNVTVFLLEAATGRADKWLTDMLRDVPWFAVAIDVSLNVAYAAIIARIHARRFATTA